MSKAGNIPLEESIVKGQPIQLRQTIELQFRGGELEGLKEQNKQIILTESAGSSAGKKRKLRVTVEGIHTGMTKNLTFYPGTALEASVPTWTTPHYKPVLKNHNSYTEPLGRIVSADYVESTLTDKYNVRLILELTDEDAIDKVLDGRYLTLSVGGSANKVNCSVCAKNIVEEGFCGHYRGRKYETKTAHWIIGEYTGDEISFVNMPADVHSQVIAAELVSGEGGKNMDKPEESAAGATSVTESVDDSDLIDGILGENAGQEDDKSSNDVNSDNGTNGDTTESADDDNQSDEADNGEEPGNPEEDKSDVNSDNALEEDVDEDLQRQLKEANEKIQNLEQKLEESEADNLLLSTEVTEAKEESERLKAELQTTKEHLQSAEDERKTFESQNLKLAQFARKALAERVVDLRIMHGKDKPEDRETALAEWANCSSKVLQSSISDLVKTPRNIPVVESPAYLVDEDDAVDGDGDYVTESTDKPGKSENRMTLADMEETMVSKMSENYSSYPKRR
ncbi:hypothetical protein ACK8P5_25770 (plasmid) [Paenibacillus sp. EC2-1]|uniref:hypothetical protein n=1 Tax=Paenibacillus sp. EC2-1 TaxID=3388665 RepID=UPI003BEEBE25